MQDAAVEVELNILVVDRLRNKVDKDIPRRRVEASTSSSFSLPPQMDEVTKVLKFLSARMERLELEGKPMYRNPQNTDNRGFMRPNNNAPQIMPREQRRKDRDDQRIQAPLQNNLVDDEEGEEEELDHEIHCIEDTSPFPHLTQSAYEESLMNSQINELSKGKKSKDNSPNRYNLRSKKKEEKSDIPDQPLLAERPANPTTITTKEKKTQNISPTTKDPVPEVREIPKPPPPLVWSMKFRKSEFLCPFQS
jgi:hypothetical protein